MSKAIRAFEKQKKYLSFLKFLDANPKLLEEENEKQLDNTNSIVCPVCNLDNECRSQRDQESSDPHDSNAQVVGSEGDRLVP